MPPQVDFLPMAIGPDALVDPQANYAGSGYQINGFQPGITLPAQFNKGFRQGTVMASAVANFISATLNQDVLDNGDMPTLIAQLTAAIQAIAGGTTTPKVVTVEFGATSTLNCSIANPIVCSFELSVTGNTTIEVSGQLPGQLVVLNLINPAGSVSWAANIHGAGDPPPGMSSTYLFRIGSDSNLYIIAGPTTF